MSVRLQRPGYYEIRVYAGMDPITKKPRRVCRGFKGSLKEAKKLERQLLQEVDEKRHLGSSGTFAFLLEEWFAQASPRWSPKYRAQVRQVLDQRLIPSLGAKKLHRIAPVELDRLYHQWEAEGLSPASIGKYHAIIRRSLNQGLKWGWVVRNPALQASPPPLVHHPIQPPSPTQLRRVLASLTEPDDLAFAAFVRVAAATGARRGEVCALRSEDFEHGKVTIGRSISQVGRSIVEKDTKTHQTRRVALDNDTLLIVAAQLARQWERAERGGVKLVPNCFVFSRALDASEPWKPDTITRKWSRLRARWGIPTTRIHDLRHAVATDLLAAGMDVRTVAGRLGHAQASTTLNIYSAWVPQRDEDAAAMLGARLNELPRTTEETEG